MADLSNAIHVIPTGVIVVPKFEVMATVERDNETVFLPTFYVDAVNAPEARRKARTIVGGISSVAVIAEGLTHFKIGDMRVPAKLSK